MPLKKPKQIPKVPKARKTSIEKLKVNQPVKKKSEPEYVLTAYFYYHETERKQYYVIRISTIKEFSSLSYGIATDVMKERDKIEISLLGLTTRQTYLQEPKPAFTDLYFENLFGEHQVSVMKRDGSINTFVLDFNVFKKKIELVSSSVPRKKNNRIFCIYESGEKLNTFPGS